MSDLLPRLACLVAVLVVAAGAPITSAASGADELARLVASRPANAGRVATMNFRLVNRNGAVRERSALMAHAERTGGTRIAIFFEAPAAIRGTAFLSHDRRDVSDEVWLYLPATQRVRRLPSSQRGDYFLGTDLTFGDLKSNFKFELDDWRFSGGETVAHAGRQLQRLRGEARDATVRSELGYAGFDALIDPQTRFPVVIEYTDRDGAPLKRVELLEQSLVGGAWTAMRFRINQHQTRHLTEVTFTGMRHVPDIAARVFDPEALSLGVPAIP